MRHPPRLPTPLYLFFHGRHREQGSHSAALYPLMTASHSWVPRSAGQTLSPWVTSAPTGSHNLSVALGTSLGLFRGLPSPSSSSLETAKALNIEAYKSPDRASGHWLEEGMVGDGVHVQKSPQGGECVGSEQGRCWALLCTLGICLLHSVPPSGPFSQSWVFSSSAYVLVSEPLR